MSHHRTGNGGQPELVSGEQQPAIRPGAQPPSSSYASRNASGNGLCGQGIRRGDYKPLHPSGLRFEVPAKASPQGGADQRLAPAQSIESKTIQQISSDTVKKSSPNARLESEPEQKTSAPLVDDYDDPDIGPHGFRFPPSAQFFRRLQLGQGSEPAVQMPPCPFPVRNILGPAAASLQPVPAASLTPVRGAGQQDLPPPTLRQPPKPEINARSSEAVSDLKSSDSVQTRSPSAEISVAPRQQHSRDRKVIPVIPLNFKFKKTKRDGKQQPHAASNEQTQAHTAPVVPSGPRATEMNSLHETALVPAGPGELTTSKLSGTSDTPPAKPSSIAMCAETEIYGQHLADPPTASMQPIGDTRGHDLMGQPYLGISSITQAPQQLSANPQVLVTNQLIQAHWQQQALQSGRAIEYRNQAYVMPAAATGFAMNYPMGAHDPQAFAPNWEVVQQSQTHTYGYAMRPGFMNGLQNQGSYARTNAPVLTGTQYAQAHYNHGQSAEPRFGMNQSIDPRYLAAIQTGPAINQLYPISHGPEISSNIPLQQQGQAGYGIRNNPGFGVNPAFARLPVADAAATNQSSRALNIPAVYTTAKATQQDNIPSGTAEAAHAGQIHNQAVQTPRAREAAQDLALREPPKAQQNPTASQPEHNGLSMHNGQTEGKDPRATQPATAISTTNTDTPSLRTLREELAANIEDLELDAVYRRYVRAQGASYPVHALQIILTLARHHLAPSAWEPENTAAHFAANALLVLDSEFPLLAVPDAAALGRLEAALAAGWPPRADLHAAARVYFGPGPSDALMEAELRRGARDAGALRDLLACERRLEVLRRPREARMRDFEAICERVRRGVQRQAVDSLLPVRMDYGGMRPFRSPLIWHLLHMRRLD